MRIDEYLRRYFEVVGNYTLVPELENAEDGYGNPTYNPDGTRQKRPTGNKFVQARLRNPDGTITSEHVLMKAGEERESSYPQKISI